MGLVAALALAEEVGPGDALEDAERLGDSAELLSSDGSVAPPPVHSGADGALVGWHALGGVQVAMVRCPVCGAVYDDDEAAALPVCPSCGVADTWEARQGAGFRALVAEIDGCASLGELAAVGKRLYALAPPRALSREQAGVAWSHYGLRKAALEAAVVLGARARELVAEVERVQARALPALGVRFYRQQHAAGATGITAAEWRRIWQAYRARRPARVA